MFAALKIPCEGLEIAEIKSIDLRPQEITADDIDSNHIEEVNSRGEHVFSGDFD